MREYVAIIWPARTGEWSDQPYVAHVDANDLDEACEKLSESPLVETALIEEDSDLSEWLIINIEDDPMYKWCSERVALDVIGPNEDSDYPLLVIVAREDWEDDNDCLHDEGW